MNAKKMAIKGAVGAGALIVTWIVFKPLVFLGVAGAAVWGAFKLRGHILGKGDK